MELVTTASGARPCSAASALGDAVERRHPGAQQLGVARVAEPAQRFELVRLHAVAHEIEDAAALAQAEVDEERLAHLDAEAGERVARRGEIQVLGIHEHAVVVEEDGLEHA